VAFALRAGARRLVLFHHDPMHTDEELDAMLADAEPLAAEASIAVELAREGAVYELR
jgi:phosphoribosyl 1,2-cyclic phosphodiesterase